MAQYGDNIILIGMPGAGKSTVGVLLAKELARGFVDTDLLIQSHAGKTLQDIIYDDDYHHLRELEQATLLSLDCASHVIATGGSVVYSDQVMKLLSSMGQVVYLQQDEQTLERRIHNMSSRGIAKPDHQSFTELYLERTPLYERYADIVIECGHKPPADIVSEIIYREGEQYADMDA